MLVMPEASSTCATYRVTITRPWRAAAHVTKETQGIYEIIIFSLNCWRGAPANMECYLALFMYIRRGSPLRGCCKMR